MGRVLVTLLVLLCTQTASAGLNAHIKRASSHYGIDHRDMLAILWLESSGGTNVKVRFNTNGTVDFGPFQINSVHATTTCKEYDILTDKGNVYCAAKLIAKHKKHASSDSMWVARYHSKTPHLKVRYFNKLQAIAKNEEK